MPEEDEQQTTNEGHPAWQEILEVLPEELHPLVTPKLQEWDQKVKGKLEDTSRYDAYKPLIDNEVPLDRIEQALYLAYQFENDPETVIRNADQAFKLGLLQAQEQQQQQRTSSEDNDEDEFELDPDDPLKGLENHPAFKQIQEQAQRIREWEQQQEEEAYEEEASEQLEEYLKQLHEEHGEFDDTYVTALLAYGIEPREAVEQYQTLIKSEAEKLAGTLNPGQQTQQPPVVVGGSGTTGSGLPENTTRLGDLSKNSVADLVEQYIQNAQSEG